MLERLSACDFRRPETQSIENSNAIKRSVGSIVSKVGMENCQSSVNGQNQILRIPLIAHLVNNATLFFDYHCFLSN